MTFGYVNSLSYFAPSTAATNSGTSTKSKQDDERAQHEKDVKAAQEAFAKRIELAQLKAQNREIISNLGTEQENAEIAYQNFVKTKNSKGSATLDTGQKGAMRWLSNAGTALCNMGKSIAGFDKDGNWDAKKCITNVGITALAIGATFIPYIGPVIGYGLLATGVAGGAIGVANGVSKLEKAEKSGDQRKIDEAQQDICGNAFIGVTSALGLRGLGKAFRTSSLTAEAASSATARTSSVGKCAESISNFGRDITVNAFRATKQSAASGLTPSLTKFRSWDKQYKIKNKQMTDMYTQKLAQLDEQILAETNPAKKVLLQEQKQLLEANSAEFSKIGRSIKSKADFDKLNQDNMAKFNQDYVQSAYTKNASGEYDIGGTLVKEQEFLTFQNRVIRQQRAIEKELQQLIKAKENMMRTFAKHPKKHRAALDEYVSTTGVKRSKWKPSTWFTSKELLAIGGKNPSYTCKGIAKSITAPASNVPKAIGAWVDPIHSGAMLFTTELSPEETQAQIDAMQTAINGIKTLREKMITAESIEDFNAAMAEYEQLVAAANGEAQTPEAKQAEQQ